MDEFRMARAFTVATVLRALLPSTLVIPVCLVVVAFIPGHRTAVMFLAAVAAVGVAGVRLAGRRRLALATVVRLSPRGVEMEDCYGSRMFLAWEHVERVGVVESRIPSPRTVVDDGRIVVRTGAGECVGLVGRGEYEIPHNAPDWLPAHRARLPVDPATGLRRIGVPLGVVDPLWEHGPMGERVRHHRPDLFEPVVAPSRAVAEGSPGQI